jgi:hypothetical protein
MGAVCSDPKQVAVKFSPEGDPALFRVRPAGRLPVTVFTGAQTERLSNHIINHPFRKHKDSVNFFIRKISWLRQGGGLSGKGLFPPSLSAILPSLILFL